MLESIKDEKECDVIIIDDCSTDDTLEMCKGYNILTKPQNMGLTHSWNMAYKYFKENNYDIFFLSNNDVLIPKGTLSNMIRILEKTDCVLVPLSTKHGVATEQCQYLEIYYPDFVLDLNNPENYKSVQERLNSFEQKIHQVSSFNGYFMGFNKSIEQAEFSKDVLFNPTNRNVHQEGDLRTRLRLPFMVSLNSFVFHYKNITLDEAGNAR